MERIAIIKPSALGDIVHALPVLTALRRRFPDAHLTWIVNRNYESLLIGHPHLNATLPFDRAAGRHGLAAGCRSMLRFAQTLRRQRFSLVIDLQGLLRTGLMTLTTGAARTVGFANAREGAAWCYRETVPVPDADRIHAVTRYWRMAEYLGCGGPVEFHLPISRIELEATRQGFQGLPRPWLTAAVGARWVTKRWPAAHFGALLARAQDMFGGTVLFLGTAEDRPDSRLAAQHLRGPWRDLTGATSLPRLTAILRLADVMIANDTGPLHVAAALGTPCVAPYTCTKPMLHGPFGQAGGVAAAVPCHGSYLKQCPNGLACFAELTPARLWPTLEGILTAWQTHRQSA